MLFSFRKVLRYGTVTLSSYIALFLGTLFSVEVFQIPPIVAYPIVLTLVYVGVYFASSTYVFHSSNHGKQWKRFVATVCMFWILNATLYSILVQLLSIQYLLSVFLNILIFGPLRYFVYQAWVFKEVKQHDNNTE